MSINYRQHKKKIVLSVLFFSLILVLIMEIYHFYGRKQVLYNVSVEKLLIITKALHYYDKKQTKLYNERFKKISSNKKLIKDIKDKNYIGIRSEVDDLSRFFKSSTPNLIHLHLYDKDLSIIYAEKHKNLHKFNITHNPVLKEAKKTNLKEVGYVKTSNNHYYKSMIYPIIENSKLLAYVEFGIKADNFYKIVSKAGRYKYAFYLNENKSKDKRELGKEVISNSDIFKKLNIDQAFVYKYANTDSLVQYNDRYYLFYQYDIETTFQKNFAQVIIAKDVTKYVKENIDRVFTTLEISTIVLSILAILTYMYLSKLIDKIENEEKELNIKQNQLKTIIDNSENLITLFQDYQLVLVNNSFLSFISCHDIEEFIKKYSNIAILFQNKKHTFVPKSLSSNYQWIHEIEQLDKKDRIVAIDHKHHGINYFSVNITNVPDQPKSRIIIFSNITSIFIRSKESEYKANHDNLTHIYNREHFDKIVNIEIHNHKIGTSSMLMLDLDFFKRVNDTYGHQVGDEVLINFTKIISKHIRTSDTFARWGGEEFVVLLKDTPKDTAFKIANTLREMIKSADFKEAGSITCSIGLSEYRDGDTLDTWLSRVDEALYKAKENGRNRVEII